MSDAARPFHFLVPGSIDRRTGGSIYDRRIATLLPAFDWHPVIHELEGAFPVADETATAACREVIGRLPDDARILVDGLVLPAAAPMLPDRRTPGTVILCHHPVVMEAGWSREELACLRAREAKGFSLASMVIAPSRQTLADVRALGYPLLDGYAVHPGSDPVIPEPDARTAPHRPVRLLCVANLMPRKGHDVLLAALTQVADLGIRLTCVGSGASDPAHARKIMEIGGKQPLRGRVTFTGDIGRAELETAYASADIFVLASRHEGFGMVFSEAVRRGLPVIATRAGAIPEAAPADASILVPPDDADALAAAIRALVSDPSAYAARATAALAAARDLPDWTDAAGAFAAALNVVWGRHG